MERRRLHINTMGCQMNVHDSALMARLLVPLGFVEEQGEETADCILINTCAIREKAAHKVYSYLGRLVDLKRRRPRLVIIVAGCVAQGEADEILKRAPHVNLVLGTHAMGRINLLIREAMRNPFEGIGKPEPLKHALAGWWSRRINDEHRLVYRVAGDALEIAQLRYHY